MTILRLFMINDPNILKELEGISPVLARLQGKNVFSVPEGYFSELPTRMLEQARFLSITDIEKGKTQEVPKGYFQNLSNSVLHRIKAEYANEEIFGEERELKLYPALGSIGKQNIFAVPSGYFENLSGVILEKIRKEKAERVVSISSFKRLWQYAAAAIIVFGLFTTSYFIFLRPGNVKNSFAVVNKNTVPDPEALKYNTTKAFNDGLASLSDDEIVGYLENHGSILDNDMLIKNIDTDELPDVTDYLISDEALTNYLNKINNKESLKQ